MHVFFTGDKHTMQHIPWFLFMQGVCKLLCSLQGIACICMVSLGAAHNIMLSCACWCLCWVHAVWGSRVWGLSNRVGYLTRVSSADAGCMQLKLSTPQPHKTSHPEAYPTTKSRHAMYHHTFNQHQLGLDTIPNPLALGYLMVHVIPQGFGYAWVQLRL